MLARMWSRIGVGGLCALLLLIQTDPYALAEEGDCIKHKAGASGPGACSLSESESWCQIAFRSEALQNMMISALGEDRATSVFSAIPAVFPDLNPVENAYVAINWILYRNEPNGQTTVGGVTRKQFVDTIFILAAVPGIVSDPERSDNVLRNFGESVLAIVIGADDPSRTELSDENYSMIFAEFTGRNEIALEPLPLSLPNGFAIVVSRGCFEIIDASDHIRSMVQAPSAPAAGSCLSGRTG